MSNVRIPIEKLMLLDSALSLAMAATRNSGSTPNADAWDACSKARAALRAWFGTAEMSVEVQQPEREAA